MLLADLWAAGASCFTHSTKQKSHTATASSTCYSHQSHISGWESHINLIHNTKWKRLHKPISNISCSVENLIKTHITSRHSTDAGQYSSLFEEHYKHKVYVRQKSNSHKCNYTTISKKERVITSPVHSLNICKQQTFACHMQLWHVHDKTDACLAELCQMCFLLCYNAIKLQLKNMFTPEKHKPKQPHAQIYVTLNAMRLGIKHKVPYLLTKCHIHTRKSQTKTATCTNTCYSKCHVPGHKTFLLTFLLNKCHALTWSRPALSSHLAVMNLASARVAAVRSSGSGYLPGLVHTATSSGCRAASRLEPGVTTDRLGWGKITQKVFGGYDRFGSLNVMTDLGHSVSFKQTQDVIMLTFIPCSDTTVSKTKMVRL